MSAGWEFQGESDCSFLDDLESLGEMCGDADIECVPVDQLAADRGLWDGSTSVEREPSEDFSEALEGEEGGGGDRVDLADHLDLVADCYPEVPGLVRRVGCWF